MNKISLTAKKRELTGGRKAKHLRQSGELPATVYGRKIKSHSVSVTGTDFTAAFHDAGSTGIIELTIDNTKQPVLIHHVQIHPVTGQILHIEFHEVDLKEKVKAMIPLLLEGESPAVTEKIGVVLHVLQEVEIEALPAELPDKIAVDIHTLIAVNDEITIANLIIPKGVKVLADSTQVVARISELVAKEPEVVPQATVEAVQNEETTPPATQSAPEEAQKK